MAENLTEAAKEARRAYKRAWAKANREKVKAYTARYWERKAAELQAKEDPQKAEQ